MLGGIGEKAGSEAAGKIADAVDSAVPQITNAALNISEGLENAIQNAVAALADGIGQVVATALRVDGATVQTSGIEISIKITNPSFTLALGPYKK